MMQSVNRGKPPIGLMPRRIHEKNRLADVREAILRYLQDGWPINPEWVEEYNQLVEQTRKGGQPV